MLTKSEGDFPLYFIESFANQCLHFLFRLDIEEKLAREELESLNKVTGPDLSIFFSLLKIFILCNSS